MPSWTLHLLGSNGKHIASHHQEVTLLTRHTVFIKGKTEQPSTWHFADYYNDTQLRSDWIVQVEFEGGGVKLSTDIPDTFIKPALPAQWLDSRVELPCSIDNIHHFALLRHGDILEFDNLDASVKISFEANTINTDVQVESSGAVTHKIKREKVKEEVGSNEDEETDDESIQPLATVRRGTSAEDSQHLFSTSREHLSPTPRPTTRESQIVQDTPNRRRIRSQNESIIPESLPLDGPQFETSEPAFASNALDGTFAALPDIHTGELPDTSPSEMLAFQLPKEPTPSPMESFSAEQVGELVSNLNDGNPPSQVLMSTAPPKRAPKSILIPSQLYEGSSTRKPAKATDSPEPQDTIPAVEVATAQPEQAPSPVEIINNEITNDHKTTGSYNDDTATNVSDSVSSKVKSKTPAAAVRKRKVTDSGASIASSKRAKFAEDDASTASHTPASTASRRGSGKARGLETPTGSAPTRSSSRRRSVDDELPPGSISRRVSNRHRSAESESVPPGSPSLALREYTGPSPIILFSNTKANQLSGFMKFLRKQGATEAKDIKVANFLCVGAGELRKTPKLLHSLTLGKTIVTDEWVNQSSKVNVLLDPSDFLPEDLKATKSLDRTKVFTNQIIYVTPALRLFYSTKKGWDDVMAIVRQAGGTNPQTGPLAKLDNMDDITLFLGMEQDDEVAAELQEMEEKVYKKDVLGASIVHGELQLDETLELPPVEAVVKEEPKTTKATPKSAKKAGRKKA